MTRRSSFRAPILNPRLVSQLRDAPSWRRRLADGRHAVSDRVVARSFSLFERLGVHVTLANFYGPVPRSDELVDDLFAPRDALAGVDLDVDGQLDLLTCLQQGYAQEYQLFPERAAGDPRLFHLQNGQFGSVDAEFLYAFLRDRKPQRMIEIGSGYSTRLASAALTANAAEGSSCKFVAIDPFAGTAVRAGIEGLTELIEVPVQRVPVSRFSTLSAGDVLFIDSSHVCKAGSDVQFEFFEILPRLVPGVAIHFHDIFLPSEYPRDWLVRRRRFWNEQYLLHAFLLHNPAFKVLWASSFMCSHHLEAVVTAFPSADDRVRPGSFWIEQAAGDSSGNGAEATA